MADYWQLEWEGQTFAIIPATVLASGAEQILDGCRKVVYEAIYHCGCGVSSVSRYLWKEKDDNREFRAYWEMCSRRGLWIRSEFPKPLREWLKSYISGKAQKLPSAAEIRQWRKSYEASQKERIRRLSKKRALVRSYLAKGRETEGRQPLAPMLAKLALQ